MEILATSPENEDEGRPLNTTVSVTFDEEADPDSVISSGNFIVTTSTSKLVVEGPGMENLTPQPPYNILDSDVFSGIVEGEISSEDNLTFTFTPTSPLNPNATYKVILGTKIKSKTIGELVLGDENTSTGTFTIKGPYTGEDDEFVVTIRSTGALGAATFSYHKTSGGVESSVLVTDRSIELEDGVFLSFRPGTFQLNDTFSFEVFEGTALEEIYSFTFFTGSPSYVEVNSEIPSFKIEQKEIQGFRRIDNVPSVDSESLALVSITPSDRASNVALGFETITLTFNKDIDPDSISDAFIEVLMENLPLDETEQMSVPMLMSATVSGKKLILRFQG
jgi:hypothetical protein